MNKIQLSALLVSGLLVTSCGPTVTPAMNSNMNASISNMNMNINTNAMNANAVTSSGTTTSEARSATFTAADVAKHNTEADCYAIVAGSVYDLTKWIGRHPGGPDAIMATCGKDISDMTHPGGVPMSKQVEKVAQYKIGILTQ